MDEITFDSKLVSRWVAVQAEWDWIDNSAAGIGLIRDGSLIAGLILEDFRGSGCTMHIAANSASGWMRNRSFLRAIGQFMQRTGCIRLTAPVPVSNEALCLMLVRVGLTIEAVLRRAHFGQDLLLFVLWLDKPNLFTRLEQHGQKSQNAGT